MELDGTKIADTAPLTHYMGERVSDSLNWSKENPESPQSGGNGLSSVIGGSVRSTGTAMAGADSIEGTASSSGRMTRPAVAKAREALWAAICFSMSVAD